MNNYRILLVDDDQRILRVLTIKLKARGYEVLTASTGREALELSQTQDPDLVVMDVIMPGMDGFDTLKELRRFSPIPAIMLSARGEDADKIKGLMLGADDYLPKPFNADELLARIEAVKRRLESSEKRKTTESRSFGNVTIDFARHSVKVRGQKIKLTRIEWLLLSELALNAGRLLTYEHLLTRVWGPEYRDDVHLLRTWISRLRNKVEQESHNPALIQNMPKAGYIIEQNTP